jgi:hypothetical protein
VAGAQYAGVRRPARSGRELLTAPEAPLGHRGHDQLRVPVLAVFAGVMVAAGALILAAVSGAPYLGSDGVNGWIVLFAAALFIGLLAVPFALEGMQRARRPESDARWERVVPAWGAIALAVLLAGVFAGASGSFAGDSLAGSAGLVATIEAGLVVIALGAVLLSG